MWYRAATTGTTYQIRYDSSANMFRFYIDGTMLEDNTYSWFGWTNVADGETWRVALNGGSATSGPVDLQWVDASGNTLGGVWVRAHIPRTHAVRLLACMCCAHMPNNTMDRSHAPQTRVPRLCA